MRARSSIGVAFVRWFATADPNVRREVHARRRRGRVALRFPRYPELRGLIGSNRLCIEAVRHGLSYDYIVDVDCAPIVVREGVICGYCQPVRLFSSCEALWCDHIFNELASLAHAIANSIGLTMSVTGGWSQARLMKPSDLRDLSKMAGPNDGTRTLIESIMSREVIAALDDWRQTGLGGVLISMLAYGFYAKPRFADEVVLLVPDGFGAPDVEGFDVLDHRSLGHTESGTRVWLLTPSMLMLSAVTAQRVLAATVVSDGVTLASRSGLGAMLLADRRVRASADIVSLLQLGQVDANGFGLPDEHLRRLERLQVEADEETRRAADWEAKTGEPW